MRPFAGQVLWNKTWSGTASSGEPPPPSPHLSPLILYQLGRRKFASLSSSQEFTSQQENESWHFASQNRDFPLSLHDGFAALLSQPVKTFAQKGLGRLSAPISPVFPPMGNLPHEGMKPPLLAQCGPFLAIQPHKLVHPPQALDFFQPPGAFFIFTERRDAPHPGHGPAKNQKGEMYRLSSLSTCFPA